MANKIVEVVIDVSGLTGLVLKVAARGTDAYVNGAGDALTENTVVKGVYTATVTAAVNEGFYRGVVYYSNGAVCTDGRMHLKDVAGTYYLIPEDGAGLTGGGLSVGSSYVGPGVVKVNSGVVDTNVLSLGSDTTSLANLKRWFGTSGAFSGSGFVLTLDTFNTTDMQLGMVEVAKALQGYLSVFGNVIRSTSATRVDVDGNNAPPVGWWLTYASGSNRGLVAQVVSSSLDTNTGEIALTLSSHPYMTLPAAGDEWVAMPGTAAQSVTLRQVTVLEDETPSRVIQVSQEEG